MPAEEYARRRAAIAEALGDGVMILAAGAPAALARDVEAPFRPDSDFFYVCGFPEPHAVAVLRPAGEHPFTLFVQPRNRERETWTGPRLGPDGARELFGADAAFPLGKLPERLPALLDGARRLFYEPWRRPGLDHQVRRALDRLKAKERFGARAPLEIVDPGVVLHEMRLRKSEAEIALLERACAVTVAGHRAAMRRCRPGVREYQIQAALEAAFAEGGGRPGFATIVAAGRNACYLHYTSNDGAVGPEDLVLVDAGAAYGGYTGDVSRTFPASGRFSAAQRDLYRAVLDAERAAVRMVRPGITVDEIHEATVRRLTSSLVDLGCLSGDVERLVAEEAFKPFFMHRTSHWLGLDVHDAGRYRQDGRARPLEPGMVLTIEPGLYIPPDAESAPEALRGQAVRIEDDVLVTAEGGRVLTDELPAEPEEVEALVGEAP
ncbi:MAG: M24 family metallopeptidase [Acidobacteria bacterium]|nr:MAG: M24 family metallopeptidase [Acidobacteriota bacterium]